MTSSSNSATSTALVKYNPRQYPWQRERLQRKTMHDLFMKRAFEGLISETRQLYPITIRDRVLAGAFPQPEIKDSISLPFNGTCEALLNEITDTVHTTLNNIDYNGLPPYLKVVNQLEKGKSFREVKIDSKNEEPGTTCVGMSHALLKQLKEKHGIEGAFAVERERGGMHPFEHAAVIIECTDGFVLLDTRSNPANRIFAIPFESTKEYNGLTITAAKPGSTTPLNVTNHAVKHHPEVHFEYCTHIANGDDLVLKHYVMDAASFVPISMYNPDGSARKFIKVVPNSSEIIFIDRPLSGEERRQTMSFESIRKGELRPQLEAFMKPEPRNAFHGFHQTIETIYQHLTQVASQAERIKQIFQQANPDETF
jgi:hypothetical protein